MASAFSGSLMASGGGWKHEISKTRNGMTMKFLPLVGTYTVKQNQKKIYISGLVCKLKTIIPKIQIFVNTTSRHSNFTNFDRIVHIAVRNEP